jgi:DNA-binding CsgD family transcriptional regulator
VIIALLINKDLREDKHLSKRDMIANLSSLGLKSAEIANILGKSLSYVSSELSQIKKRRIKKCQRKMK